MTFFEKIQVHMELISLYQRVLDNACMKAFLSMCRSSKQGDFWDVCRNWCLFYKELCLQDKNGSFPDFLFSQVFCDENPYTLCCEREGFLSTHTGLRMAAKADLSLLADLAYTTAEDCKQELQRMFEGHDSYIDLLPSWCSQHKTYKAERDWGNDLIRYGEHYWQHGAGVFAMHSIFLAKGGLLVPLGQTQLTVSAQKVVDRHQNMPKDKIIVMCDCVDDWCGFFADRGVHFVLLNQTSFGQWATLADKIEIADEEDICRR